MMWKSNEESLRAAKPCEPDDSRGETVDMRGVQGPIHKSSRPVEQQFGPQIVVAGEGAHVTITLQEENVHDKELAYLDEILKRYEYWREHYTPLTGIAEMRGDRVLRGGSWNFGRRYVRCACRDQMAPDDVNDDVGFRVSVLSQ